MLSVVTVALAVAFPLRYAINTEHGRCHHRSLLRAGQDNRTFKDREIHWTVHPTPCHLNLLEVAI